jgi:anti-anti-sigma factor
MRDEPLTVEVVPGSRAETVVLQLRGPLTLSTLFALQDALRFQPANLTILDLSQVPYMDSAGLGTILISHVSAEKNGRKLVLAGVSERISSLIHMTRVDSVLHVSPTVEDAERIL